MHQKLVFRDEQEEGRQCQKKDGLKESPGARKIFVGKGEGERKDSCRRIDRMKNVCREEQVK